VLRYDVAHECNGVRLADIERQLEELGKIIASLHEHQVLDARWVSKLESKLTETRERFGDLERDVAAAVLELRKRVEELDRPLRATDGSA
jgi:predicted  nucleic acid-binding Zn-ribbon protein